MAPSWRSARFVQKQDCVSTTCRLQVVQETIASIFMFAGNTSLDAASSFKDANGTTIFSLTEIASSFPNSSWMV